MCQLYRLKTILLFLILIKAYVLYSYPLLNKIEFKQNTITQSKHQLPVILIQTGSPHIKKKKTILGKLKVLDSSDHADPKWQLIDIKRRGNSSDSFAKKQYSIKFYNNSFDKKKLALLDHAKDSHWVLNGPYVDRSLIRNALAYKIGQKMGALRAQYFAPKTTFVEIYINNDYKGIYVLIDKLRVSQNKINIPKLKHSYSHQLNFIAEISALDGHFQTQLGTSIKFVYPNYDKLQEIKAENKHFGLFIEHHIKHDIERFERLIRSRRALSNILSDPNQTYFDQKSFIDFIIIQEIFKNVDGFRRSVFFHKSTDGKIRMGPIWDFNLAMGNINFYNMQQTSGWLHHKKYKFIRAAFWFSTLLKHSLFKEKLITYYKVLRQPGQILSNKSILFEIDQLVLQLQPAISRNQTRWNNTETLLQQKFMNTKEKGCTHQEHIHILKQWLLDRLYWIDREIDTL